MANIITDVAGIKNVRMTNARFARQPLAGIFTGWSKIRVALYLTKSDSGGNITGTPRFGFGLCAGSSNILGDATTTHFCGIVANSATWTRSTAPVRYTGVSFVPATRIGSTLSVGTPFSSNAIFHSTLPQYFFVDITTGSPNYSCQMFAVTAGTSTTTSEADFLVQSVAGVPVSSNHTLPAAQTIAVDEATNGTFDHACVWWDQAGSSFDILHWRVFRLI